MNHSINIALLTEALVAAVAARGLRQGKAFRRHCAGLATAARYQDLEDIHKEVAATQPRTWADIDEPPTELQPV